MKLVSSGGPDARWESGLQGLLKELPQESRRKPRTGAEVKGVWFTLAWLSWQDSCAWERGCVCSTLMLQSPAVGPSLLSWEEQHGGHPSTRLGSSIFILLTPRHGSAGSAGPWVARSGAAMAPAFHPPRSRSPIKLLATEKPLWVSKTL